MKIIVFALLLSQMALAEIVSEKLISMGSFHKQTLSIREHKVKSGEGYSMILLKPRGSKVLGKTISKATYNSLIQDLESITKNMHIKKSRSIASCVEVIVLSSRNPTRSELRNACLSDQSIDQQKKMTAFWKKALQEF